MRILFIGTLPPPVTGQSLACQVLHESLVKTAAVEVINLSKASFRQGVNSIARVREVLGIVARAWRRRNAADVNYFTIVESRAGNAKDLLIYVALFRRLARTVVHLHGGAGLRELVAPASRLRRAANGFFLRRLGGVIVLGQRHVDIFDGLVAPERIHIVANFAQDELFLAPAAIRAKFAQPAPVRVLFLSNLLPGKGYQELVAAYASLDESQRARLQLDFAGGFESDADRDAFLASIEALPGANYHGTVHGEQKLALFAAAHAFCLPTYYPYEGQPISILEAYASGCVVLTTDHSGIFDTFTDGENGIAVEKRSVASLAAALAALLQRGPALLEIALRNREAADARYRAAQFTRNVEAVIARVAAAA